MTTKVHTIRPSSDYLAAIAIMRAGRFRRMPVCDQDGQLVGIISASTLLGIKPPQDPKGKAITSDGVLIRVGEVMTRDVITVSPDYPLEEAANLLIKHHIGALPVVANGKIVGMITDTDIFRVLVQVLGGGSSTVRITLENDNVPGQFAEILRRIAAVGGNILSIASHPAESETRMKVTMRIEHIAADVIVDAISQHPGLEVLNVWQLEEA